MSTMPDFNKFTYEQYVHFPSDGMRHEIVDGDHFMNPAPNLYHQTISRRIQFQLYTQIETRNLGWVFNAPVDVKLTEFDVVQPDVIVVLQDRAKILTETRIDGAPNLVIEILSKSTASYDRSLKLKLYQRTGVPEYWIVDPDESRIEQYVLENLKYVLRPTGQTVALTVLDNVVVDTSSLWD
jgi:Uma2 family endonuclease